MSIGALSAVLSWNNDWVMRRKVNRDHVSWNSVADADVGHTWCGLLLLNCARVYVLQIPRRRYRPVHETGSERRTSKVRDGTVHTHCLSIYACIYNDTHWYRGSKNNNNNTQDDADGAVMMAKSLRLWEGEFWLQVTWLLILHRWSNDMASVCLLAGHSKICVINFHEILEGIENE